MPTPPDPTSEMLNQVSTHLEFLGYTIEPPEGDKSFFSAKHPKHTEIVFRAFGGGLLFTAAFLVKEEAKKNELQLLKLANSLNSRYAIARAVIDGDKDLVIELNYRQPYVKKTFGAVIEELNADIDIAFTHNDIKDTANNLLK